MVCSAVDTLTNEKVAIKKIHDIFEHVSDAARILREIKLLRLLRHPDIVEIKHIMLPPSRRGFKDIFVVFELMESDLHQVIKANDDLTKEHYQFFLYQLLRALKFIHTGAWILHCTNTLPEYKFLGELGCSCNHCYFLAHSPFWLDDVFCVSHIIAFMRSTITLFLFPYSFYNVFSGSIFCEVWYDLDIMCELPDFDLRYCSKCLPSGFKTKEYIGKCELQT